MMINNENNRKITGLYLHIPFCSHICHYCDFYKMRAKPETIDRYVEYLCQEIIIKKALLIDISTIYIGGGTPSSLKINQLEKIFQVLQREINFKNVKELTVEANPNDVKDDFLFLLHKYQVNRLSIGIQSFNKDKLTILGRNHSSKEAIQALVNCQNHGFTNINVDIIFGVPNENFQVLKNDLNLAIKYGAKHLSLYSLILEEKTILTYWQSQNRFKELDDDKQAILYEKAQHYLESLGYHQYEISNFSKEGYPSLHNLTYWNNEQYLGIGASASFYLKNVRYTNPRNLESYFNSIDLKKPLYDEEVVLTKSDQMREHLMLGLRKTSGINLKTFKERYQEDVLTIFPEIKDLISSQMLVLENDFLFIPKDKLFLSNEILIHFV
ncbi:MAG: radical SAM family heme chaperone HemW [Bacilli bacterium]